MLTRKTTRRFIRYFFGVLFLFLFLTFYSSLTTDEEIVYACSECDVCRLPAKHDTFSLPVLTLPRAYHSDKNKLPFCNATLQTLQSEPLSVCIEPEFSWDQLNSFFPDLEQGGLWTPKDCIPTSLPVAIVIPYRDRDRHLLTLLYRLHAMLQRQRVPYGIYVAEQEPGSDFNRGMMKNIGYVEANKLRKYGCVFFHDVDLLPEDDRNLYDCPPTLQPRHHVILLDIWKYKNCYTRLVGGVFAAKNEHMDEINGFSNLYFNWGGEDDDFFLRLKEAKLTVSNIPERLGRYTMLKHSHDKENQDRFRLLFGDRNKAKRDGLNSLKYQLVDVEKLRLYTLIRVKVDQNEVLKSEIGKQQSSPTTLQHITWNWHFVDLNFLISKLLFRC